MNERIGSLHSWPVAKTTFPGGSSHHLIITIVQMRKYLHNLSHPMSGVNSEWRCSSADSFSLITLTLSETSSYNARWHVPTLWSYFKTMINCSLIDYQWLMINWLMNNKWQVNNRFKSNRQTHQHPQLLGCTSTCVIKKEQSNKRLVYLKWRFYSGQVCKSEIITHPPTT